MVNSWNLAAAWVNRADAGTVTASGSVSLAPPSVLQNKHVHQKWRANASSAAIICDYGTLVSIDTVALMGLNSTSSPTRVRLSTADSSGADGSAYDSLALPGGAYDPNYLPFVHLLNAPVSARYMRIDLSGISYIEAGRLFGGVRSQFAINFQPGWGRAWIDPSVKTIGRSGQTFDDLRDMYRTLDLTVSLVSEADRWNIIEEIDIALGAHGDMLVMTKPSSSNLSRDSLWGYIDGSDPVIEPDVGSSRRFRRTYKIRERL